MLMWVRSKVLAPTLAKASSTRGASASGVTQSDNRIGGRQNRGRPVVAGCRVCATFDCPKSCVSGQSLRADYRPNTIKDLLRIVQKGFWARRSRPKQEVLEFVAWVHPQPREWAWDAARGPKTRAYAMARTRGAGLRPGPRGYGPEIRFAVDPAPQGLHRSRNSSSLSPK
jgi:hypothetical protein